MIMLGVVGDKFKKRCGEYFKMIFKSAYLYMIVIRNIYQNLLCCNEFKENAFNTKNNFFLDLFGKWEIIFVS